MNKLKFKKYKTLIVERLKEKKIKFGESVTLINSFGILNVEFSMPPDYAKIPSCIPLIILQGDKTGQLYFFPLATILPDEFEGLDEE